MSDGSTVGLTRQSSWQSSKDYVATVGSDINVGGYVQALSAGSTTIQASYQGVSASVPLAVVPLTVTELGFKSVWCDTVHQGVYDPLACIAVVNSPTVPPLSTGISVVGDYSALQPTGPMGGFVSCPLCNHGEWDADLHIPANAPLGPLPIPITVSDKQGRSATQVAIITIIK
jgi:hypothetical protein